MSNTGKWLVRLGFPVGTGANLTILSSCLLLITESREEMRALEQQLKVLQEKLDQARQQIGAMLA